MRTWRAEQSTGPGPDDLLLQCECADLRRAEAMASAWAREAPKRETFVLAIEDGEPVGRRSFGAISGPEFEGAYP